MKGFGEREKQSKQREGVQIHWEKGHKGEAY